MNALPTLFALAGLASIAPTLAQDVRKVDPRERLEQEVDEKARRLREGQVIRTNVRVTVRLENGSRLRGVVKNGRFIERHDGLSFVPSDLSIRGAGLRLWYTDQSNGYVFLPYETIQGHSIGDVLTDAEVREIGLRMAELEKMRASRRSPSDVGRTGTPPGPPGAVGPGGQPPVTGPLPAEPDPGPQLTEEQQKLLAEFPPEAGWSEGKLKQLERDKIVIDRFPNEQEARFIEVFDQWNEARQIQEQAEQAATQRSRAPLPSGVVPAQGGPAPGGPAQGGPAPTEPPTGTTNGSGASGSGKPAVRTRRPGRRASGA